MTEPETNGERDDEVARRLESGRPAAPEGFSGRLRKRLGSAIGERLALVRTMRTRAAAFIGAGALLLAVAALGVVGVGPFAT